MHSRYEHNGLIWVDLESPSRDEVQDIMDEFAIAPLIAEELLLPATKPRVEFYQDYVYLVLHFPALQAVYAEALHNDGLILYICYHH